MVFMHIRHYLICHVPSNYFVLNWICSSQMFGSWSCKCLDFRIPVFIKLISFWESSSSILACKVLLPEFQNTAGLNGYYSSCFCSYEFHFICCLQIFRWENNTKWGLLGQQAIRINTSSIQMLFRKDQILKMLVNSSHMEFNLVDRTVVS